MPSRKVQQILENFRARFQPESAEEIPISLRQESTDVVFLALLEEDKSPMNMPTPLMGFEVGASAMQAPGGDPGMMLDELLGASMGSGATPPPELTGEAPVGPPGEPGAADIEALLGMM
jgi:hypothetical protein